MANTPETYAAVDLGSNSFHMIVANWIDGRIQVVDKLKDTVRLAGGLDENQKLTDEAIARALECLQRFGQRIMEIPPTNVHAVGTNTLRRARNSRSFLKKATQALGHNIGIISGREEARLIFLGIAYSNYHETEQRLIIDIGGGSTELAIGQGYTARMTESLYMGCVSMSDRYFSNGEITAKKMRKAILTARQELESIENKYKKAGWDSVYGSSGTILAIRDVIKEQGSTDIHISKATLEKLKNDLIEAGHTDKLKFTALPATRLPVFPGGVAILSAAFEALNIEHLNISDGALREGLLLDLIGRLHDRDIRDKTVTDLLPRFNIDVDHAKRVEATIRTCYKQLRNVWSLDKENDLKLLRWSALLHETGLTIAHSQYHKHGAYLLNYSDLPGFSREEQSKLAFLVRCHRRKISLEDLQALPEETHEKILRLAVLLRLSVLLNRGRSTSPLPEYKLSANNGSIEIKFPENWLPEHPLTEADLASEAEYLSAIKTSLIFS